LNELGLDHARWRSVGGRTWLVAAGADSSPAEWC
jgi:hypothetical protein